MPLRCWPHVAVAVGVGVETQVQVVALDRAVVLQVVLPVGQAAVLRVVLAAAARHPPSGW